MDRPRAPLRTRAMTHVLVTGATGYVGGRLIPRLIEAGHAVRALARRPEQARLPAEVEVVRGDVVSGEGLADALAGVEVAHYLVHSMGGRSTRPGDFADLDRRAAEHFGAAAARAGIRRLVYLGGLESTTVDAEASAHLRSRQEVAAVLAHHVPTTVHVRAAMVIGAGSSSFLMLRGLVERLPAMICPRWIDTRTQPVAIADVEATLTALVDHPDPPTEIQLGGADVLTYCEMMRRYATVIGRRRPVIVRVPVLSPTLSSYWVSLVTLVEPGLARPLVQGLSAEMVVRESPPAGINDRPLGFEAAVRAALSPG